MKPAHKHANSGCDVYGEQRLQLAQCLLPLLPGCWIENGTLLGATRNGAFIPHDDDLDLAVLVEGSVEATLDALTVRLQTLPPPYRVRVVRSYADKLEVYDPTEGVYALPPSLYGAADYHHVTVDIQLYMQDAGMIHACYRASPHHMVIPQAVLLPLSTVRLEGVTFPCPHNSTAYLVAAYGDISTTAVFDPTTGVYCQPQ